MFKKVVTVVCVVLLAVIMPLCLQGDGIGIAGANEAEFDFDSATGAITKYRGPGVTW